MNIRSIAKSTKVKVSEGRELPLHYSLTGEVEPSLAPLSIDYSLDPKASYRYDWIVGVGPAEWYMEIVRKTQRAITVQLLVDCHENLSFSDSSPMLVGLNPAWKATSSWLERYAPEVGEAVKGGVGIVGGLATPVFPLAPLASSAVQLAANFIKPGREDRQSWFMYRFLDGDKGRSVIEWNIGKEVLEEYGPLLRGSIVLSFHGQSSQTGAVTLLLRPRLGFEFMKKLTDYLPPYEDLEKERPVHLLVRPQMHS